MEKFDKNNDGFISKSEFKKKIKFIIKKQGKDITNDEIKVAFKIIDTNGDGQIGIDEVIALPNMPLPRFWWFIFFDDKNNDGFISKSEFKKKIKFIIKKQGKDITNDEIKVAFKIIDANGDGQLDIDEVTALPNMPLPRFWWILAPLITPVISGVIKIVVTVTKN